MAWTSVDRADPGRFRSFRADLRRGRAAGTHIRVKGGAGRRDRVRIPSADQPVNAQHAKNDPGQTSGPNEPHGRGKWPHAWVSPASPARNMEPKAATGPQKAREGNQAPSTPPPPTRGTMPMPKTRGHTVIETT